VPVAGRQVAPRQLTGVVVPADPAGLTEWLTASSASDEVVEDINQAAVALAEAHPRIPAAASGTHPVAVDEQAAAAPEERDLLRVNGEVLAHMSLLLSDLNTSNQADAYGNTARLFLREAGASEGTAWYVLAKNARWRHLYGRAADLARRGLESGPPVDMAVQLACYEANASAMTGDRVRAADVMRRAERDAASLPAGEVSPSPWSFPPDRMTIFRLSVALYTGNPDGALEVASAVDPCWHGAGPHVPAAWAQTRIGAGIARVLKDEPDGAAEEVQPVFSLPPERRIATVTGWLTDLDRRLADAHYKRLPVAVQLHEQIREFKTTALDGQHPSEDKEPA
jgi:hypothetical protein